MGKVLFLMVAAVASLAVVETLVCNKCPLSLWGYCVSASSETCGENVTRCFTRRLTLPSILNFEGFSTYGCESNVSSTCGAFFNTSTAFLSYTFNDTCCNTTRCNTIFSSAPTTKTSLTFTAAIGGALLASLWGGMF